MNPFQSVPVSFKKWSNFDESHSLSGTFPLSSVVPVLFIDSLPGSSWSIDVYNLTKLETLIAPAMQRVDASLLWFKMPKRLVFKHFKKWYSGDTNGNDQHQKPFIHLYKFRNQILSALTGLPESSIQKFTDDFFGPGSLWNYLGLPCPLKYDSSTGVWSVRSLSDWSSTSSTGDPNSDFVDLLPLMAYNFLYDCYFRDQTLNDPVFVDSEDGNFTINKGFIWTTAGNTLRYVGPQSKRPAGVTALAYTSNNDLSEGGEIGFADVLCIMNLFNRAWRKEYFTSALPTPQRGPEVQLNLVGDAPVTQDSTFYLEDDNGLGGANSNVIVGSDSGDRLGVPDGYEDVDQIPFKMVSTSGAGTGLSADLSGLSPITIVALRNLFKLQQFMEKNNVAGGRYIETILAHWGERVPDFTVQRPQFVRATSLPVQISEVTATANTSGFNNQVGDQAGRARTQGNLGKVRIYTHEPEFIFGLYCVTAPGSYAGQGIPRIFQHVTRFDEPWTNFQHIGEQAVKLRELYFPFEDSDRQDEDFGYQQRYSEYKYMPDRVVGDFQTSMAYWHMARMFNAPPALNGDFVTQNLDPRIFAVQNGRPVTADFFFRARAKLKLSKYSTPKMS